MLSPYIVLMEDGLGKMAFIDKLLNDKAPFVIKGNFSDEYQTAVVLRVLSERYDLIEVTEENLNIYGKFEMTSLFEEERETCYIIKDHTKINKEFLKSFGSRNTAFLVHFSKNFPLDLPEIPIPRLSGTKQSVSVIKEWVAFLGYAVEVEDTWQEIKRPSYDILMDIEKTLLAYDRLEPDLFNRITEAGGTSIQLSDLLKGILTGNMEEAFVALEKAWNSDINIERSIEWFNQRLDNFFEHYYRMGQSMEESFSNAKISGIMKKLITDLSSSISAGTVDRIWEALSTSNQIEGKAKDIIILLKIFNKY